MQYEVPLPINMSHDMSGSHYANTLYVPSGNNRIKSEAGSDRGISPLPSDSSRYSSQTPQNSYMANIASQLQNGMSPRYPSPAMQQQGNMPMIQHTYHPNPGSDQSYQQQAQMGAVQAPLQQDLTQVDPNRPSSGLPKAFACSTCAKGFARRSDLARHGRLSLKSGISRRHADGMF